MLPRDDRLTACWRSQSCADCMRNNNGCGWCPVSSTCVPASSLLEPITNKDICPFWNERFELRTATLGCGCSTTTFISIVVTILATIAGFLVLYGVITAIARLSRIFGSGTWRGIELEMKDSGGRVEREWVRGSWLTRLRWNLSGGSLS